MCGEKGRKRGGAGEGGGGGQVKCLVSSGCGWGVIAFSFCFDVCVWGGGGRTTFRKWIKISATPTPLPDTLIMNGPLIVSTLSEGTWQTKHIVLFSLFLLFVFRTDFFFCFNIIAW